MNKVKITVLKTTLDKAFVREYGIENLTAYPMHKVFLLWLTVQATTCFI